MTIKKLCRDCGAPLPDTNPRTQLCETCRKKKSEEEKNSMRSLAAEDAARRAARMRTRARQRCKSIAQCVREAAALGISYGQYVARGLDQADNDL